MKLSDFEKIFEENNPEKDSDKEKELKAELITMARENLTNEDWPNGLNINHRSGLEKIKDNIRKFFEVKTDPYANDGWVKVVGITNPYVGTGLTGAKNKIFLGDDAVLPQTIADQLIKANQVREIK